MVTGDETAQFVLEMLKPAGCIAMLQQLVEADMLSPPAANKRRRKIAQSSFWPGDSALAAWRLSGMSGLGVNLAWRHGGARCRLAELLRTQSEYNHHVGVHRPAAEARLPSLSAQA